MGCHLSALEHLGAAVGGVGGSGGVVDEGELHAALEEDVVRGEAAVDDAARVRVPQRVAQLPRNLHLVVHRHLPVRGEGGQSGLKVYLQGNTFNHAVLHLFCIKATFSRLL